MDQYLEVFIKVVEKENFSKAAEELHMTQPAVSQYIRNLEEAVGTRLLERSNKFVRLNKPGEIVYHHAKEILALYTKMQYLVDDLTQNTSGPLSIGASYTFGEYILPHIVARLKEAYPNIQPSIIIHNTKDIVELVRTHQLDVGVIEGVISDVGLYSETVSEDNMVVVASANHPLVKEGKQLWLSDLETETWILREKGSGTRQAAENMFKNNHFFPRNIMEFGSTQLIKESVEAGLGISLLSKWAIVKELTHSYMCPLKVKELPFRRDFSYITHSPFQTKALKSFIETLKQYIAEQEI